MFVIFKQVKKFNKRLYSSKNLINKTPVNKLRNIGILAHIDAGKTTTTERMLFYSGSIHQMGEVHHGNTVTDFMEQERERGITITSAAVTFMWKEHQFNLIDTPGHIDFTMEVEQTLSVLDGAVVVLDGSAGVEAQTVTVWRQADRHQIPRIVFVNKMDRSDADLSMCYCSIEGKLGVPTLCLHLPIRENGKFIGLIDIITLQKLLWKSTDKGITLQKTILNEKDDVENWTAAKMAREKLIDRLSTYDDFLANEIIQLESLDAIKTVDIIRSLRTVTLQQKAVPVLCGSAYKNIGIQPLMDSVINFLPSPVERNQHFQAFDNKLCAKAFKVRHDKQRGGALVFFRIYSGVFEKGQRIYNIQKNKSEQTGKLYVAYADDVEEVQSLNNGNIAVVTGLKETCSGDLITNIPATAENAKKKMYKLSAQKNIPTTDEESIENLFGMKTHIPEPVFFCSIEPPSAAYQSSLEQALIELQREDPSFRVTYDEETGQTILAGMGELHLDIIKDRILKEYKIDADLGPLQIGYREAPIKKVTDEHTIETRIGKTKQLVSVRLSVIPNEQPDAQLMILDKTPEASQNIANIYHKHLLAVRQGIKIGTAHGPKINSPVVNIQVMLHMLSVGRGTSETIISSAVTQLVQKLLRQSETSILEPMMNLDIVTPKEHSSVVLADLAKRRANILNVSERGSYKVINTVTPLSELLGYSTDLRTITSGTSSFTMEFAQYQKLSSLEEANAIKKVRGF